MLKVNELASIGTASLCHCPFLNHTTIGNVRMPREGGGGGGHNICIEVALLASAVHYTCYPSKVLTSC